MIIRYGDGWIKFPDVVWEPSGRNDKNEQLWVSRPITSADTAERKKLETEDTNESTTEQPV